MSKIRVRFFSSFCDSDNCKSVYERLCDTSNNPTYGSEKDIFIVSDDSYTHAIVINTATPTLLVPKENVIGLAFEPTPFLAAHFSYSFLKYTQKYISKYLIGDTTNLQSPFQNQYAFMWHITPPTRIPVKNRLMSIMVSQKTQAPGHQYRHTLVDAILKSNLDIDIYGRGCQFYSPNDSRIKGQFNDDEPYENYHFHICIENFSLPNYTSEKYTNPVLWGTTPIYWGAHNPLFPELTITLSGDVKMDMILLRNIIENPEQYKYDINQNKIRQRLNLIENLQNLFSTPFNRITPAQKVGVFEYN